ncbi:MAG: hypothetical protein R3E86_17135 [Pseudomonadales bacterium]
MTPELAQRGVETRSEAVYADAVSENGDAGVIVRLCRYPALGTAWVWGHLFRDGAVYGYTHHELPCSSDETEVGADLARYHLSRPGMQIELVRRGPLLEPEHGSASARLPLHRGNHPPHGPGEHPGEVTLDFSPDARPVSNLPGRNEMLGRVTATISIDGERRSVTWRGHFHEQVQSAPRFTAPFTYLTLRGDGLGLIAIRVARGTLGQLIRDGRATQIGALRLAPPGRTRRLALTLADGTPLEGWLETTYDYSVPVFDTHRPGTLVRGELGGVSLSGCVNDYLSDQLRYDRF